MKRSLGVCTLRYRDGEQDHSFVVGEAPVVIGRSPTCDLTLSHESISREHARITYGADGWTINDLDSKNGVKINTYRSSEHVLQNEDRVDLGALRIYVDISPFESNTRAQVVFDDLKEAGMRTGIIEMDQLGTLLGPPLEPASPDPNDLSGPASSRLPPESGEWFRLISDAAEALISCDSLDETLERILALVFDNLPAERGVICLYDEATDQSEAKATRTRRGEPGEPIEISSHIVNDVIKRRQSVLVQDTLMDDRYGGAESVIMMKIRSAMCAPLYREGRVVGFVYVDRQSEKRPFNASHLQALSALAMLSAVAVEQAVLREEIRREQEIRSRLARYSSRGVVDRIVHASGVSERGMVVEESEVSVIFADLTGFTTMAERMPAASVVQLLNQVFERLTEAIFEFDGTLDKFRGDGLMAFFGAPLAMADHADRAVQAALRMQELLADLNAYSPEMQEIAMRIGINSGSVVVGDVGSPQRKDYTVIGDVVNIASRLESSIAQPGQVVVGHATWGLIGDRFRCQQLEEVRLRGKRRPVRPYLILGRS